MAGFDRVGHGGLLSFLVKTNGVFGFDEMGHRPTMGWPAG
jgi:hypothetical protein